MPKRRGKGRKGHLRTTPILAIMTAGALQNDAPPSTPATRITDASDTRITDAGDTRILER